MMARLSVPSLFMIEVFHFDPEVWYYPRLLVNAVGCHWERDSTNYPPLGCWSGSPDCSMKLSIQAEDSQLCTALVDPPI